MVCIYKSSIRVHAPLNHLSLHLIQGRVLPEAARMASLAASALLTAGRACIAVCHLRMYDLGQTNHAPTQMCLQLTYRLLGNLSPS